MTKINIKTAADKIESNNNTKLISIIKSQARCELDINYITKLPRLQIKALHLNAIIQL